jgi:hypothetical protein
MKSLSTNAFRLYYSKENSNFIKIVLYSQISITFLPLKMFYNILFVNISDFRSGKYFSSIDYLIRNYIFSYKIFEIDLKFSGT